MNEKLLMFTGKISKFVFANKRKTKDIKNIVENKRFVCCGAE